MSNSQSSQLPPITRELFEEIANKCGTDKSRIHGYHRFFTLFLSQLSRGDAFTIIEIGYGQGESIQLWKTLFPNSDLICLDRDISKTGEGYTVIKADQNSIDSLQEAIQNVSKPVQLIIDDGSHHPQHQLTTFSKLFSELLEEGGFYIVEDIETSYWLAGELYGNPMRFGLFSRWSAIEAFKLCIDYTNRLFISEEDKNLVEYSMMICGLTPQAAQLIESITFGQNCVIAKKSINNDKIYSDRPYTYSTYSRRH